MEFDAFGCFFYYGYFGTRIGIGYVFKAVVGTWVA